MAATIRDVAQDCGLPLVTVKRVLDDGLSDITDRTRRRVLRSAKAVGYAVAPRTHNLGMLFWDENAKGLTHPFFAAMLNSFKNAVETRGYDVTFISHNTGADGLTFLEHCRYRNVDGVCLACLDFTTQAVRDLVSSGIPCVTVDHKFDNVPAVLSDNENGVHMLVDYAVSMGHRRIAFIHGHNNSVVTSTRIAQFHSAMEYHGLPVTRENLRSGLYNDIRLVRGIIGELLRLPERPTCILLPDDSCYFGAQEAAHRAGLRIPGDISFMGYDGISLTRALSPSLTTIHQDSEAIGRESARRLIDLIENPEAASRKSTILPVRLIKGGTVADLRER